MIQNLSKNRILWALVALLSLVASLIGALRQDVYSKVISTEWLPGTISQDLITIIASLALLLLSARVKEASTKKQIVALSLLAYLFYGYGIFVIERVYNPLYILYMAIFAISFWSIVYGLISVRQAVLKEATVPTTVRYLSIGFLIFIPLLFYVLWTSQLLPLMQTGRKIDFTYSIYILDMVFVLPAFVISAVLVIKKNSWGLILAPILFFKAFTLLLSVGLGGVLRPFYNQSVNSGETVFYLGLSLVFLILSVAHLVSLKVGSKRL